MKKVALFAFNGEPMCFIHVLLNALDMHERGYEVKLVIEGSATRQIPLLNEPGAQFGALYRKVRAAGLIDCVCHACAARMEALDSAREQGLAICAEMSGHPGLGRYLDDGYEIVVF
ncbi:cytoplasmic protein [bacterium]|nr:cytoplasmic protein [candidate division CSSED10-310 bacterium]